MSSWLDYGLAAATIIVPLGVAWAAYLWASRQDRNSALTAARLRHYEIIAPDLNALMCYFRCIGAWKGTAPTQIIEIKRRLDTNVSIASPLFDGSLADAYQAFRRLCFARPRTLAEHLKLRTPAAMRKQYWPADQPWDDAWDGLFVDDAPPHSEHVSGPIRDAYDEVLRAMAKDIRLTHVRAEYTTRTVIPHAAAPDDDAVESRP